MRNDLDGLQGKSAFVTVSGDGDSLPDKNARFVVLSNWQTDDDVNMTYNGGGNENLEAGDATGIIYYGFGEQIAHPLAPGETSDYLPVSNLQEIRAKVQPGQIRKLFYTYFR